jgi:hypothetical protein
MITGNALILDGLFIPHPAKLAIFLLSEADITTVAT